MKCYREGCNNEASQIQACDQHNTEEWESIRKKEREQIANRLRGFLTHSKISLEAKSELMAFIHSYEKKTHPNTEMKP